MAIKTVARNNRGSELVQVAVTAIFLIPIALFFIDVIFVVLASTANSDAAKLAARAAANHQNSGLARAAAEESLKGKANSRVRMKLSEFTRTDEYVKVLTKSYFKLPVPFPLFSEVELSSGYVVEPVVCLPNKQGR